jgi:2-oxoisovalerate dehydrogenase E1 component
VVERIRRERRPALLHLRTVRFLAHAGTDVETSYRSGAAITADLARDPLLALGRLIGDGARLAERYDRIATQVATLSRAAGTGRRLRSSAEVMAPLVSPPLVSPPLVSPPLVSPPLVAAASARPPEADRARVFAGRLPEEAGGLTLAQAINAALTDELAARPQMFVFGEDVGRKGGVYGVTRGLAHRFRSSRVFDTLLDEQAILGLGLGLGVSGLLPVPEIQYLAYLHNAEDQVRGEAASLRFFSNSTYGNPMVIRVAGLAYQKGFGGHFHNDNAVAVLRDIPGLVVAVPARPDDAAPMLRACLAAAADQARVSVFLEPIALYHERDLHAPGDRGWLGDYGAPGARAGIGTGRTYGEGADLTIVSFGNGVRMSLRVAARLAADGIAARVLDLRWIAPLPIADLLREATATGRVLVADETRHAGGVGEGVITALVEHGFAGRIARVASADSFIPLGDAANLVLLAEATIEQAARDLVSPSSGNLGPAGGTEVPLD